MQRCHGCGTRSPGTTCPICDSANRDYDYEDEPEEDAGAPARRALKEDASGPPMWFIIGFWFIVGMLCGLMLAAYTKGFR